MPSTDTMRDVGVDFYDDAYDATLREKMATSPYCDDLSGMGSFMTPPSFGCVLHEPKEPGASGGGK